MPTRLLCTSLLVLACLPWGPGRVRSAAAQQPSDDYDRIVDDFIEYDVGRLRGRAGQMANARFQSMQSPQAIPSLVRGVNRAARLRQSCPVVAVSAKLQRMLQTTADAELLRWVVENLDQSSPEITYGTYLDNIRQIANHQLAAVDEATPEVASALQGGGTAAQLRRSRKAMEKWSYEDLLEAVSQERGTRLLQVLEELKDRKGARYTGALADAIAIVGDDMKPLARGLLSARLTRMSDRTLISKLKDPNPEVRAAAAEAVGYKGTPLYKELAAALRDPNPRVVAEAHAVLVKLLGEDFGPRPEASGLDCFEASRRWEQWIEEHESAAGGQDESREGR